MVGPRRVTARILSLVLKTSGMGWRVQAILDLPADIDGRERLISSLADLQRRKACRSLGGRAFVEGPAQWVRSALPHQGLHAGDPFDAE